MGIVRLTWRACDSNLVVLATNTVELYSGRDGEKNLKKRLLLTVLLTISYVPYDDFSVFDIGCT